jgi:hypothetical protein
VASTQQCFEGGQQVEIDGCQIQITHDHHTNYEFCVWSTLDYFRFRRRSPTFRDGQ